MITEYIPSFSSAAASMGLLARILRPLRSVSDVTGTRLCYAFRCLCISADHKEVFVAAQGIHTNKTIVNTGCFVPITEQAKELNYPVILKRSGVYPGTMKAISATPSITSPPASLALRRGRQLRMNFNLNNALAPALTASANGFTGGR